MIFAYYRSEKPRTPQLAGHLEFLSFEWLEVTQKELYFKFMKVFVDFRQKIPARCLLELKLGRYSVPIRIFFLAGT